jgi:hypothetical protein
MARLFGREAEEVLVDHTTAAEVVVLRKVRQVAEVVTKVRKVHRQKGQAS